MSNSFKHKAIVASLAAVFAIGTMSVAQANTFADTTQAVALSSVIIPKQSSGTNTALTPVLTGQTFTLTEAAAGAFTAGSTVDLTTATGPRSGSFFGLQLNNTGAQAVNFQYLPSTSSITLIADNSIGIAAARISITATQTAASTTTQITLNGDTWQFAVGATAGTSISVTKNGVSVASGLSAADNVSLAALIAAQFNSAYGAGTAAPVVGTANVINIASSRATFAGNNAAAAITGTATITELVNGVDITGVGAIAGTTGLATVPVINGAAPSAAVDFSSLTALGTASGSNYIIVPIIKNNSTAAAKIVLSNIAVNTASIDPTSTTLSPAISLKVDTGSTTAGVSKGSSTTIASVASLNTAVSFGSPVSVAPGGTVSVPTLTLTENLPASLLAADTVTFTLPTSYTWGTTNAVVSVTSAGGSTTTITSLTPSSNVLTLVIAAASVGTPSKITISGLTASAPSTAATGSTSNVVLGGTTASFTTTQKSATGTPYLNVQGGSVSTALNGTAASVYTFRNYASGKNGGALAAKVNLNETLSGTLLINTALNLNLTNAVSGSTTAGVTTVGSGPTFGNATGSGGSVITTGTAIGTPGYSAAGAVFSPSSFSYNISTASTTLLTNTITLGSLTIGPAVGPVTVGLTSNTIGTLPTITVANATNASNTSVTGAIPSAALAGAAVTLPTITLTESAAGALQTEVGGIGQVSFTLTNGTWDVAASQTATWCGAALPASNITGSSSSTLTVNLATVSTAPCALVLNGKATAALTAAPGAAISVKVNATLSDTGQATRQELQVATVATTSPATGPSFGTPIVVTTAAAPTGQVVTPLVTNGTNDQGKKADTYVIAYYQGVFLYKKKTPAGCAGWTGFSPQTGGIPQAYETGVTLGTTYQLGNINDCDVTALKGVSYYVGYGVGSSIFGNAQTWNAMLANGTFSNTAVFLTN